jgi:ClpP class serine protease
MGLWDVLWLFFIVSVLQPELPRRPLERRRLQLLARLQRRRGSRVIAPIHRQETMSLLGFPLMRYVNIDDSEAVLQAVKLTHPDYPIDLTVHPPGGLVLAAGQIAHALRYHPGEVTVFVPHHAMSGGTLIVLAVDELVMDENAVLGPVDPQVGQAPAASILNVLGQKDPKDIDDRTLICADVVKAMAQVKATVEELLVERMPPEKAKALATQLASGVWTHDHPITVRAAQDLGLPVSTAVRPEVYEFMSFFTQPTRTQASVEYVPVPYPERQGRPQLETARWKRPRCGLLIPQCLG